ncbi:sodium/glutamate symporter [Cyanobium sp. LEGE 06113]|uniref:sodium/glutamate symporter n=1 Tax=Cyanobium sp. LEGE 06113 TaxID=1297573 RepID=UPI00187F24DE|nr:sodium/glutamate symporter [Cyanobium sp. LEGE 06113]MBE9153744.1 sodium/glutamate symporter [Cyanobium sp. LEGE 06113]
MQLAGFATFNVAIMVLAAGKLLTRRLRLLSEFSIPEPVSSGLLVCLLLALLQRLTGVEVGFDLATRDFLLLYFFAGIGLNADVRVLLAGGRPLAILVALTMLFLVAQNLTGITVASLLGLDPVIGLLAGSTSLVGGHGTAIAWAPRFAEQHGIANALEIGAACATFGLVLSSLMGGPIARFLIRRHRLSTPAGAAATPAASSSGRPPTAGQAAPVTSFSLLATLFWLNVSLALGELLEEGFAALEIKLPLFVCCLFAAIVITNTVPRLLPIPWPAQSPSLALVSEVSLGIFLAMSLMSLQLWTLAGLGGPLLVILAVQFAVAVLFAALLVFPAMGRDYEAAVVCAGFGGFSLGATPTAMANMAAVAGLYGSAERAFLVVPLVSGFFIDISNSLVIQGFLQRMG